MRIILLRHGDALPRQVDLARPLSALGCTDVQSVGAQIGALDFHPAAIFHSPMLRAAQSAALVADALDGAPPPVAREDLLPSGPLDPIVHDLIAGQADVMLVGHLPWLRDLADELLESKGQLAPALGTACALVLLRLDDQNWILEQVLAPER